MSHGLWNVTSAVSAGEQMIDVPGNDLLAPEEHSTEERSNSAFLTKILAGKLPITRLLSKQVLSFHLAHLECARSMLLLAVKQSSMA